MKVLRQVQSIPADMMYVPWMSMDSAGAGWIDLMGTTLLSVLSHAVRLCIEYVVGIQALYHDD